MALTQTSGFWPVMAAIVGNATVTVIKFLAALASGSSSLMSESIHSLADTLNQLLLLIGLRRSLKKADETFEYGYGQERFFWALISACGIFFVGAGVTAYHGITTLSSTHAIEISWIVYLVLLISLIIESYTWYVADRNLRRSFPHATWRNRLRHADSSTLAVYLEDAVAVFGVLVAAVSITLTHYTGNHVWDSAGSLIIALLLGSVAVFLIAKNRTYLIGHSIPNEIQDQIIEMLRLDSAIERIVDFKSSAVGFASYRIRIEIEFNGHAMFKDDAEHTYLREEFEDIRGDYEAFKRFAVDYADRMPRLIGKEIDRIEHALRSRFPMLRHIDIEIN